MTAWKMIFHQSCKKKMNIVMYISQNMNLSEIIITLFIGVAALVIIGDVVDHINDRQPFNMSDTYNYTSTIFSLLGRIFKYIFPRSNLGEKLPDF